MKRLLLLFGMLACWASSMSAQTYCTSLYTTGCTYGDDINDFTLGSFSQTATGCTSGGYADYTATPITIYTSSNYVPLTATTSYSGNEWFGVWIDWNDDGDFSDADEFVTYSASAHGSATPYMDSLMIDATRPPGTHRLRVRVKYQFNGTPFTAADACASYSFGETHDYALTVIPTIGGPNDAGVFSVDSPTVFCPGTEQVYATIGNHGSNSISAVTVNWSVNGTVQTPVSYTGTLDTIGGTGVYTAQVLLGSSTFAASTSYEIKVWTSNPNSVADTANSNDTASVIVQPALSGNFTINDAQPTSGTNFNSFNDAVTAFAVNGICGPVVLDVAANSGPYNEQVTFTNYTGSSSINTITINGNGAMIVDSGNVGSNNAVILLDGADHMTIDSLNVMKTATSNAVGIQFMNSADSNTIRNCSIELSLSATSSSVICLHYGGSATSVYTSGNAGNYNLIEGNTLTGGYYGVRQYGSSSNIMSGNQYLDNDIKDFHYYGIYNYYSQGTVINGNEMHRPTRTTVSSFNAIYNYYSTENVEITNNWIHDGFTQATGSTSTSQAIYMSSCDNTVGNEGIIANNVIDLFGGGNHIGINSYNSDNWNIYHNTVVDSDPTGSSTGNVVLFGQDGTATGINFSNNMLYFDRATSGTQQYVVYVSTNSQVTMDNNAYYLAPAHVSAKFGSYGSDVADFAAWQAVNSSAYDQNSVHGDPFFVDLANKDYTPQAAYFDNIGANLLSLVPNDISGTARTSTPDPGALEFTPPPGPDMSILNIYSGVSCGTSTDIIVEVLNQGTDTVTSFTVDYTIGGVAQTPISLTGVWATGATDSVSITAIPVSSTALTTVVINITAVAPGTDVNPVNNTTTLDLRGGLTGTYTIDASSAASVSNFTSFNALADALINYGVCGPVTVNVTGSVTSYTEQFWLDEIQGVSSVNTITINGNGNTLQYLATSSSERATVTLNGTDWVTIDSLNIVGLGGSGNYGFGVVLSNQADNNTINNCNISVADDQTSTNFAGLVLSGSVSSATSANTSGDYNTFTNNTVIGGYYGIVAIGGSSDSAKGTVIENNTVQDFSNYGLYVYYGMNPQVKGNDINRMTRTVLSSFYGLRVAYSSNALVEANTVHDANTTDVTNTGSMYPFYAYQLSNSVVANNMVYNIEGDGYLYGGMYLGYLSNTNVVHNTIILSDAAYAGTSSYTTGYGMYIVGGTSGGSISNNLFYFDVDLPNTYMIYSSSAIADLDNNVYHVGTNAPATFAYYTGVGSNTLADWQTNSGKDGNSVMGDPYFVDFANDDYTPQSALMDGMGIDFTSAVPADINGTVRNVPVDPGAIEFTGAPCTGLSGISDSATHNSAVVSWSGPGQSADILWGPVGFMQASITPDTVHVTSSDTSGVLAGMASNTCYDYYIVLNCTSTIPGAPPVMGPYTVCTECAGGALSGTYTVGGAAGPTNFATLDSVISSLMGCGIQGPVVFNLQGGTHNGFTLGLVDGVSATNTITFNGSANYGDTIIGTSGAAIDLDGAEYVTINGVYAENTGTYVVWMHNEAKEINLENSYFMGNPTTTSTSAVVAASGSATSPTTYGNNVSHVTVNNCTLEGNYYGIVVNGASSSAKAPSVTISNNVFTQQYYYGLRTYYLDTVMISGNQVSNLRNTSGSYGMYIYYNDNASVLGNSVYGAAYSAMHFNYSNYNSSSSSSNSIVANNMLQSTGTYGAYLYYPVNVDYYHNTIEGGSTYGLYLNGSATATQNVDVRNNVIGNSGTGTAFYVSTAPANTTIDYNMYYSGGNIGNGQATLTAWQTANSSWNANSIEATPMYAASDNFHMLGTNGNDVGDNSAGITVDIDGDSRPASGSTVVDMGADEYTPVTADLALINGEFVKVSKCLGAADTIMLEVMNAIGGTVNFATNTLTAGYDVTGPINSNGTITLNSGTLAAGDTTQMLGFPVDLSIPGTYTLNAWINPNADNQTALNDTLSSSVSFTVRSNWEVQPDSVVTINNMTDTVVLSANSPFLTQGLFISEISHYYGFGSNPGVKPAYLLADDYIEITGVPGEDLTGYILEQWSASSLMSVDTFDAGTVLGPNGTAIFAVGQLGSSVPSPSNYYYHANGTYTGTFSSGGSNGRIIKDPSGNIVDAVGYNSGFSFPASSGVTSADWSGSTGSTSGSAGIRLIAEDDNSASSWAVVTATEPQNANVPNAGITVPSAVFYPFDWKLNGVVVDTNAETVVGPYTASGVYEYVATLNGPCGVFMDTVTVIVNLPGSCPIPTNVSGTAPACDSIVINWNSAMDSSLVAYVATGGTHGAGSLVVSDSTFGVAGLTPNTDYDFYVANICNGDTGMYAGPYTINSGSAGAPVAAINYTYGGFGSLIYDFDALSGTGDRATYTWYFGDGNTGSGDMAQHTYGVGGSYTVSLVVTNACGSDSTSIVIADVGMGENPIAASMEVYPNPTSGLVNVRFAADSKEAVIRITDIAGKEVLRIVETADGEVSRSIDISNLSKGIYMLEVTDGNTSAVRRLIRD